MKKQQLLKWRYYTPKKGKKIVSLMRYNEWISIYPKEVLYAHESHEDILFGAGLERCEGVKVFKTKKAALKAKNNFYIRPTE